MSKGTSDNIQKLTHLSEHDETLGQHKDNLFIGAFAYSY